MKRVLLFITMVLLLGASQLTAQEDNPFITYDVPSQNLLKFNRFLINPTFSTVREDKSYFNVLHRNQSVDFDDNNQAYFLSYSGRINDRTGLGLSLYTQREGTISNYGILANYAYGIKLSEKSNFTFGANLSYYSSGFDENRANPVEIDPLLGGLQDSSLFTFQPGFNVSYGAFDFGVFAENLFDYNLKSSESITEFQDKTFSSHLQYTHQFENGNGIFEQARLMPLARVRKVGEEDLVLGGALILDLPKLGWLQGGYDSFYGASAGMGFNLNKRLSIGYTMEKSLSNNFDNFGPTHEISFAYSFTPNLTEDRVLLEDQEDQLVSNEEEHSEVFDDKNAEIEELKRRLSDNDAILAELMYRQDSLESIENNREQDLERRFEMVMRMVRNETRGQRPDLEERAKELYFNTQTDETAVAQNQRPVQTQSEEPENQDAENQPPVLRQDPTKATVTRDRNGVATTPVRKDPGVKSRKFNDLPGVEDGYYVVANVYKGPHYMNKFMDKLSNEGLQPDYIDNEKNGLKYVYIDRYNSWQEAVDAYKSGVNGTYNGDLWIMNVQNRYTNEAYAANTEMVREKSAEYESDVLQQNVVVRDKVT
ncbi:MAG: PorP/SprF family type IX secretion system membrane protein, partial [Flavobacteriaceae bacterium]|nr:PorP/SprF family type IX secretion system membrane protein [Flavobacteriaceae bacterium]